MMDTPVIYQWTGDSMVPQARFAKACDRAFVVGQHYRLIPHEERSMASHRHYFSAVNDAWTNLPDHLAERFPTSESLRKWALIKAGYRDERSIVAASKAEAQRLAAFVRPMDDFAVVVVSEATVSVYTAKSQSVRAMGKATFEASKSAVLDVLAGMVGVDTATLERNAGRAA